MGMKKRSMMNIEMAVANKLKSRNEPAGILKREGVDSWLGLGGL
jgi:hypothetical protein